VVVRVEKCRTSLCIIAHSHFKHERERESLCTIRACTGQPWFSWIATRIMRGAAGQWQSHSVMQ